MNSLFCSSDGEGTGRFPCFRLSLEVLRSAAGTTTKLRWLPLGSGARLRAEALLLPGRLGPAAPACWAGANKCAAPPAPAGGEQTRSSCCRCSRCDRRSGVQRARRWETSHTEAEMSSTAAFYLLSTLGGYLVTSFLLLKYPTLLHQRKKQRFLSKHISHRGGERGP